MPSYARAIVLPVLRLPVSCAVSLWLPSPLSESVRGLLQPAELPTL